jgi:hypothetical protein
MTTLHIDFKSESLIKRYKSDMLSPTNRKMVDNMLPVKVDLLGETLIGFSSFEEGFYPDQVRVYFPESRDWVSIPKEHLIELDGRELASLISEKYKE